MKLKLTAIDLMIAISVLVIVSGCGRRVGQPPQTPSPMKVVVDLEGWGIRKACIEGTSYILYGKTIVPQQRLHGNFVPCEAPVQTNGK